MAFEKAFENKYDELDKNTQYRFAEIEISYAVKQLSKLLKTYTMPRHSAINLIYRALAPASTQIPNFEQKFVDAMNSTYTNNPPRNEMIQYMIIKGCSYGKIRNITSASFNTISRLKYGIPYYYPTFPHWTEDMLHVWNDVKGTINIFGEDLTHSKQ